MKFNAYALAILGFVLFVSACDNEDHVSPEDRDKVSIDGAEYPTTIIGTQTWTSVNHAGPGGVLPANGKPEYGKYYTQTEAEAIPLPGGWRLPTQEDFKKLAEFYAITFPSNGIHTENIKSLISESNWNHVSGTNTSGFNANPGGYMFGDAAPLAGDIAEFWTSEGITLSIQEAGTELTSLRMLFYQSDTSPDYRFNVRFVKD